MKRALTAIGVFAVLAIAAVDFWPRVAHARPSGELAMFTMLNGEVTKLGVLASTGTSVNNTTTGTTFTITQSDCPGRVFMLDCDIAGVSIGNGATCSTDITNANYKPVTLTAHEWKYFILKDASTTICLDTAAVTGNCAVFCMN